MARLIVTYMQVDPNFGGIETTSRVFEIKNPELDAALKRPNIYCNVTLSYEVDEKGNILP